MDGHERAFARFGGCASACRYDSQKPVVLRWEGQQPIYNPRYLAFAAHYGIRPAAVRGNPNAKPRVERGFWEHERSFLNGRSFRDRDDFRAQLAVWLDRVVDPRKRHGQSALDRFRDEAPHPLALPTHPYDTARVAYRLCSIDWYVEWLGNRYAVPYDHITDFLALRVTQTELFVYGPDIACLARYELRARGRGEKIDPLGFHPRPHRQAVIDSDKLRAAFADKGEGAAAFLDQLTTLPTRVWTHHARQMGWSAMALPGRGPFGPFDRRCGMRWLRLAILRGEGTAMRWSTRSSSYRYDPFDHFPSEDQLTRLPVGDGWELRQLIIEGNGKDAKLRLVIADGRRIELGCGHVKVAVQGSLLTEVMGPGDCSLRVRYSHLAGGRLLLRTFSILHPGSAEEARSDLLAFERGDRLLWVLPHINLQLGGRSGS